MQLKRRDKSFMLILTEVELGRLLACVAESADVLTRSEFFIRTGWARDDVRAAVCAREEITDLCIRICAIELEPNSPRWPPCVWVMGRFGIG
jgi:hypothetical protein